MARPVPARRHQLLRSILLFCPAIALGAAGDPEFTYRANSAEVRLTFSALDQNNHGVATLQASDFAVVDRDVIVRNFQSFTRADWTKLDIAVLVDASESVSPHFRREMADTLDLVSETTGVPDENLSIFSFHGLEPAQVCAGNCRGSHAADRLPARPSGLTPLFDTVVLASDFLAHHGDAHAQKILIVFSDGDDTISRNSLNDGIDSALRSEVQIYCINLNASAPLARGAAVLYNLADATGGRYFPPQTRATEALNQILEGFRATYTITYRPPSHASGFHRLRILPTHNLNLQFRSRSGYNYSNHTP
jgi:VWFA-related protein